MIKRTGIYIHVPFCLSKCHYCDFCSRVRADDEAKELYVKRLCDEIRMCAESIGDACPSADTVYFGGGTPTLLTERQFFNILDVVNACFGISSGSEITAETNPKSADVKRLSGMKDAGINRLSIGMQSVHDTELRALGRIHTHADFVNTFNDARKVGFDNISVDLMYGIPMQTTESFEISLRRLVSFAPEHISSYCLTLEEGTNFYRRKESLGLPDDDTVSDMYMLMGDVLAASGYQKYEISNFAHKGHASRHNLKYWKRDDYLGFGPAAHSFFNGVRYSNSRDIEAYIRGEGIRDHSEKICGAAAADEYVMLGMRLASGIDIHEFERMFEIDFMTEYGNTFEKFSPEYVYIDENVCRFTDKGMFVSNYILSET